MRVSGGAEGPSVTGCFLALSLLLRWEMLEEKKWGGASGLFGFWFSCRNIINNFQENSSDLV